MKTSAINIERDFLTELMKEPKYIDDYVWDLDDRVFTDAFCRKVFNSLKTVIRENGKYDYAMLESKMDMKVFFPDDDKEHTPINEPMALMKLRNRPMYETALASWVGVLKQCRNNLLVEQMITRFCNITNGESIDNMSNVNTLIADLSSLDFEEEKRLKDKESMTQSVLDKAIENLTMEGDMSGIPYGFRFLDKLTNGMHKKQLITIGADSGVGKSSFAFNVIGHTMRLGYKTAYYSLEMDSTEMMQRMMAEILNMDVSASDLAYRKLDEGVIEQLKQAKAEIDSMKGELYIDDKIYSKGIARFDDICNGIRLLKRKKDIDIAVIDHIGLADEDTDQASVLDKIARVCKGLAQELDITVIIISQFRKLAMGEGKEPTVEKLKGSSGIRQSSDTILLIWRPEFEGVDTFSEYEDLNISVKGKAKVIIAKNRGGRIGHFICGFDGKHTKFYDLKESYNSDVLYMTKTRPSQIEEATEKAQTAKTEFHQMEASFEPSRTMTPNTSFDDDTDSPF